MTLPDTGYDELGTYHHDEVFLDKIQKDIQIAPDGRIEPEPQVTCNTVLPVPEAVSWTVYMPVACRLTVPQTLHPLVDGNEASNQLIVMFSVGRFFLNTMPFGNDLTRL